ncbi:protein of unknown function [Rhodovastum atsumiense]|nr:pseudopilin I [Rhodovastum atsumiense]CAH2601846.1 protein of unknown function [Rhodovastum atsumiense]
MAFVIAALALALLYRGGIEGLAGTRAALRRDEAVARATARLEAMCHGARLAPGLQEGDDGGGFRWRTRVQVTESVAIAPGGAEGQRLRLTLFSVGVTLSWPGALRPHEVSLATRCLAALPMEPG